MQISKPDQGMKQATPNLCSSCGNCLSLTANSNSQQVWKLLTPVRVPMLRVKEANH